MEKYGEKQLSTHSLGGPWTHQVRYIELVDPSRERHDLLLLLL
jgi:hypothetical protein